MPAVVRKANKLLQSNQKANNADDTVTNVKSQKRLVAFDNKSLSSKKIKNTSNKIDEFTEVKNCNIQQNTTTTYNNRAMKRNMFENTLL